MNIAHLEVFVETVHTSSISKAADNLHLTQPAASMQIQNLENSIGHQLLLRSNRGVQLTDYGKVFYSYAQSFLSLWRNLQQDLKMVGAQNGITLPIGTCPPIAQYALPCALYLFKQNYPQVQVSVQSLSSSEVISELRDHSIQIGFIEGQPVSTDFLSSIVLSSELLLVASGDKKCHPIHLSDLSNLAIILPPENSDIRQALKRNLRRYGIDESTVRPFLELDGIEGVKSAVISGHGYSLLPYFAVKKELFSGELKQVPIEDAAFEIIFSMIWRKEGEISEYFRIFMNFIKTEGTKSFC